MKLLLGARNGWSGQRRYFWAEEMRYKNVKLDPWVYEMLLHLSSEHNKFGLNQTTVARGSY